MSAGACDQWSLQSNHGEPPPLPPSSPPQSLKLETFLSGSMSRSHASVRVFRSETDTETDRRRDRQGVRKRERERYIRHTTAETAVYKLKYMCARVREGGKGGRARVINARHIRSKGRNTISYFVPARAATIIAQNCAAWITHRRVPSLTAGSLGCPSAKAGGFGGDGRK